VQERAGITVELIGIGDEFLNRGQMTLQLRERTDKWDYMKLKSCCTTKEMVTKLRRLPQNRRNFTSYTSDEGLITRMYRELKKPNSHKSNDSMKKWANELNRAFSKAEVQIAKK
jgi:hypothetical protein